MLWVNIHQKWHVELCRVDYYLSNGEKEHWQTLPLKLLGSWGSVMLEISRFPSLILKFLLTEDQRRSSGRKEKGDAWRERRQGQRGGIYTAGAVGYGELSWINSLFTLAGRLLNETSEDGASGDPPLCYGERRAGKRSPKWLAGRSPGTML